MDHIQVRESLDDLPPGARATIVEVLAEQSGATARRLADLGFTAGTVVEVVRQAPLRDPVVYRLMDYEVCLRREQAALVQTTQLPSPHPEAGQARR